MLPVSGTIRDSVKLTALENKWQQRKQDITRTLKEKYGNSEKAKEAGQYLNYQIELEKIRESRNQAEISSKIQSGAPLTPEEIEYLKETNPKAYEAYRESKREEKAYEKELERCETKEDVEKKKQIKMGEFLSQLKEVSNNPNIPEGEKLAQVQKIHAKAKQVERVHQKFVKSQAYLSLPTEEEKAEEEKKSGNSVQRAEDSITKPETDQSDIFLDEDGNPEAVEPVSQEKRTDTEDRASYEDVVKEAKEYIENHRPTGAGLDTMISIRNQWEKKKDD